MNVLNFTLKLAGKITSIFAPVYPSQRCQASDGGISIVVQVLDSSGNPVNLRPASQLKIVTLRPSGINIETPAMLYTNGFDGQMSFITGVTTPFGSGLTEVGTWSVQGKFVIDNELQYTTIGAFSVIKNLGA